MKNLNKFYIKQKENEIKKLEEKTLNLERQIEYEENLAKKNRQDFEELKDKNLYLKTQYNTLKSTLISMGVLLDIENINYNIKEWDNVYLKKRGNRFLVITKNQEELLFIDKETSSILQDIFNDGYVCSLVVIRVSEKSIKVQLRFILKEK